MCFIYHINSHLGHSVSSNTHNRDSNSKAARLAPLLFVCHHLQPVLLLPLLLLGCLLLLELARHPSVDCGLPGCNRILCKQSMERVTYYSHRLSLWLSDASCNQASSILLQRRCQYTSQQWQQSLTCHQNYRSVASSSPAHPGTPDCI